MPIITMFPQPMALKKPARPVDSPNRIRLSPAKSELELSSVHISLLDENQVIALHDRSALLDEDLLDDAGAVGVDVVLHFHGFEDHERLTGRDRIADLDVDREHGTRQRTLDRVTR